MSIPHLATSHHTTPPLNSPKEKNEEKIRKPKKNTTKTSTANIAPKPCKQIFALQGGPWWESLQMETQFSYVYFCLISFRSRTFQHIAGSVSQLFCKIEAKISLRNDGFTYVPHRLLSSFCVQAVFFSPSFSHCVCFGLFSQHSAILVRSFEGWGVDFSTPAGRHGLIDRVCFFTFRSVRLYYRERRRRRARERGKKKKAILMSKRFKGSKVRGKKLHELNQKKEKKTSIIIFT